MCVREQADEIQEVRYFDICDYVNRCSAFAGYNVYRHPAIVYRSPTRKSEEMRDQSLIRRFRIWIPMTLFL